MARCAVPVAGRSARLARARRGRSGDGKTERLPRSFRPAGRGRRSAASLPPEKFVKDIIPTAVASLLRQILDRDTMPIDGEQMAMVFNSPLSPCLCSLKTGHTVKFAGGQDCR